MAPKQQHEDSGYTLAEVLVSIVIYSLVTSIFLSVVITTSRQSSLFAAKTDREQIIRQATQRLVSGLTNLQTLKAFGPRSSGSDLVNIAAEYGSGTGRCATLFIGQFPAGTAHGSNYPVGEDFVVMQIRTRPNCGSTGSYQGATLIIPGRIHVRAYNEGGCPFDRPSSEPALADCPPDSEMTLPIPNFVANAPNAGFLMASWAASTTKINTIARVEFWWEGTDGVTSSKHAITLSSASLRQCVTLDQPTTNCGDPLLGGN